MRKGEQELSQQGSWRERLEARNQQNAKDQRAARDALFARDLSRQHASLAPASDELVAQLSRRCAEQMALLTELEGGTHTFTFFSLFKRYDQDGSGQIDFGEWRRLVRTDLGVDEAVASEDALKSIWLALDANDSGFISAGEWAAFMRRGVEGATSSSRRHLEPRQQVVLERKLHAEDVRMRVRHLRAACDHERARDQRRRQFVARVAREESRQMIQKATSDVVAAARDARAQVRATVDQSALKSALKGAPAATEAQVVGLAEACNQRLLEIAEEEDKAVAWAPWFTFFKAIDKDNSGLISFGEFSSLVRTELGLARRGYDAEAIRSVWVAMDTDGSGYISCGEFGRFMRRGRHVLHHGPSRDHQLRQKALANKRARELERERLRAGNSRLTPTQLAVWMNELEDEPTASGPELLKLSEHLNARLAELRDAPGGVDGGGGGGGGSGRWYSLFKNLDVNVNGHIEYDEMRKLVRDVLDLPATNVPESVLRSTWKALDREGCGVLSCGDFISFMKIGAPKERGNAGALEWRKQRGEQMRKDVKSELAHRKQVKAVEMEKAEAAFQRRARRLERQLASERERLAEERRDVGGSRSLPAVLKQPPPPVERKAGAAGRRAVLNGRGDADATSTSPTSTSPEHVQAAYASSTPQLSAARAPPTIPKRAANVRAVMTSSFSEGDLGGGADGGGVRLPTIV
jgi:Ca2+-binding EF-hand superfamily protein